jgi:hypothetical protein
MYLIGYLSKIEAFGKALNSGQISHGNKSLSRQVVLITWIRSGGFQELKSRKGHVNG